MLRNIKILSLFSGIGSFEHTLDNLKLNTQVIGFSEIDKFAIKTYNKNFPNTKNLGNIKDIDTSTLEDFDFLVGGPPCQNYSIGGNRKGMWGDTGKLVLEYLRILKDKKPKYFIFENVRGITSSNGGKDFELIKKELDEIGYNIKHEIVNSKNFGLAQNRERVFIIGRRKDLGTFDFQIPTTNHKTSILRDVLDKEYDDIYIRNKERILGIYASKYNGEKGQHNDMISNCLIVSGTKKWVFVDNNIDLDFVKRFNNRTLKQDEIDNLINLRIRQLTPNEYEKIQGFKENYTSGVSDFQRYKQIGNSISIGVLETIFKELFEYINEAK